MKVVFTTNIDAYKTNCFPTNLITPPSKGDMVMVVKSFSDYFHSKKLPVRLEVTRVTWMEDAVICELWYNETDKKLADMAGVKTL